MSDTFTRDRDGKKFRDFLHQEFGDSATGTEHYHIEPIPDKKTNAETAFSLSAWCLGKEMCDAGNIEKLIFKLLNIVDQKIAKAIKQ